MSKNNNLSAGAHCRENRKAELTDWKEAVSDYRRPSRGRALWQLFSTIGAYIGIWYLMYLSVQVSWWLTVPLAIVAGGLIIRIFIFFHDCGHGSFFKSKKANNYVGFITGVLTFTPYFRWRWQHARHHSTSGNLDRRGVADYPEVSFRRSKIARHDNGHDKADEAKQCRQHPGRPGQK